MNQGIESLLARLDGVKKNGADKWMACCPAHDDSDPSLAIKITQDGRILLHCFAGCDALSIVHSLDLTLSDLFPDGATGNWLSEFMRPKTSSYKSFEQDRLLMIVAASDKRKGNRGTPADTKAQDAAFQRLRSSGHADQVMSEVKTVLSGGYVSYGKSEIR